MIEIRAEKPEDIVAIRYVHQQAFQPRSNEAHLVELLRQANKTPISLAALSEGQLVGHLLFSPVVFLPPGPPSAVSVSRRRFFLPLTGHSAL